MAADARVRGRARLAIVGVATLAIVAEGIPARALVWFAPGGSVDERRAYAWLAESPPGAVLELPMPGAFRDLSRVYVFHTLKHGHPIVNGQARYGSALEWFLNTPRSPLLESTELGTLGAALRAADVRYVTLRQTSYVDRALGQRTADALSADAANVIERRTFGDLYVFVLRASTASDQPRASRHSVSAASLSISASGGRRPGRAIDGRATTSWRSDSRQGGGEHVDLTFDTTRDVSRVRLDVPRDRPYEYPRALKVESWTDDGVVRLLQQGPMLPAVLASLKRGSRAISIEIELPPNTTRRLRLTQTGASRQRWSIAEVVLWER